MIISATPEQELITPMIDIPIRVAIPEVFKVGQEDQIKINWKNNGGQSMHFVAYDDDGNGYIDHIGWIVPHLSTQTFEIVYISKALVLDSNKNTVADIFDAVKAQDQNYANITNGQFIRVTFGRILDNSRDITIYAKPHDLSQPVTIEVYTTDGQLVATFTGIDHDGKYRVLLTGLQNPSDVFDLKVTGNVDVDYIVDPNVRYWVGGGSSSNWSATGNTNWSATSGGPNNASVPDASTDVIFDTGSSASVIDTSFSVGSLTIGSSYTGTITQNANLSVTNSGGLSGNYIQSSAATFTATNPGANTFSTTGNFSVTAGTFRRYTGMGIISDPFVIYDVYGLQGIKTNLTSSYTLNNNINAATTTGWNAGAGFVSIGNNTTSFSGNFNGNNYSISNLFINSTTTNYVGLFGYSTGKIQNLTLANASINATGTAVINGTPGIDGTAGNPGTAGGNGTAGNTGSTIYVGGLTGYNTGIISNVGISGSVVGNLSLIHISEPTRPY